MEATCPTNVDSNMGPTGSLDRGAKLIRASIVGQIVERDLTVKHRMHHGLDTRGDAKALLGALDGVVNGAAIEA